MLQPMENIADILANRKPQEPEEIRIIKQFMQDTFQQPVGITVHQRQIVITVKGAALAGALRPCLPQIKRLCGTDKRFVIRIER